MSAGGGKCLPREKVLLVAAGELEDIRLFFAPRQPRADFWRVPSA